MLILLVVKREVPGLKYLKMEINTKGNGTKINKMARVNSGTKMATTMRAIGLMVRLKDMVFIKHKVEVVILVIGIMMYNMALEKKLGLMDHITKEIT